MKTKTNRGFYRYDPLQKYQFSDRILALSTPRREIVCAGSEMPVLTPAGVRVSAIKLHDCPDRLKVASLPYSRHIIGTRKEFRRVLSEKQMENLFRLLEASNGTIYAKLANCVLDLKKTEKRKKPWTEAEWRKHMEYIGALAEPRPDPPPPHCYSEDDDEWKPPRQRPLEELWSRIEVLSSVPSWRVYKRLSQCSFYRDPTKVQPGALKYEISERIKKLSEPRPIFTGD